MFKVTKSFILANGKKYEEGQEADPKDFTETEAASLVSDGSMEPADSPAPSVAPEPETEQPSVPAQDEASAPEPETEGGTTSPDAQVPAA